MADEPLERTADDAYASLVEILDVGAGDAGSVSQALSAFLAVAGWLETELSCLPAPEADRLRGAVLRAVHRHRVSEHVAGRPQIVMTYNHIGRLVHESAHGNLPVRVPPTRAAAILRNSKKVVARLQQQRVED